jgi:hypothetical protein
MAELETMKEQSSDVLSSLNDPNAVAKMVSKYNEQKKKAINEEDQQVENHYKSIMQKAQNELEKSQGSNDLSDEKIGEIAEKIIADTDEKDEKQLLSKSLAEKDDEEKEPFSVENNLIEKGQKINMMMNTEAILKAAKKAHEDKEESVLAKSQSPQNLAQKFKRTKVLAKHFLSEKF